MFTSAGLPDLDRAQNNKVFMSVYPWRGGDYYRLLSVLVGHGTFLHTMVGISGSPEAAQGMTSSLPAS